MNEEEIIKTIKNMLLHAETQLLDYEALAIQGLLDLYNKKNKIIDLMADKIVKFTFNEKDIKSSFKEQIIKFFEKEVEKNE